MADRDFFVKNGLVTGTNNVTIGNSVYIVAGGNVGIHNSSPAHDLSINGPTFFGGDIASSINLSANTTGVYHTGTINAASHTVGTSTIANATGVYTGVVNAASHTVGTAFTANATLTNTVSLVVSSNIATFGNTFYIVSNGNVGVGTATPNSRLTVLSTSSNLDFNAITGVYSSNQGPGGSGPGGAGVAGYNLNGYGVLGATSNGSGVIGVTNTGFGVAGITRLANSIAGYFGNESSGVGVKAVSNTGIPFVAANNTVDFMSILANGNVGIGNTAPADKLSVNGTTYLGGSITTANGTQITLGRQTTGGLEGAQIDWGSGNSACTAYPSWSTDVYTNQFRIFNGGVSNTQVSMSGTSTGVVGLYVQGNVSFGNTTSNAGLLVYSAANNQNFNAITGVYSSNQGSGGSGTGGAGVAGYNLNGFGVFGATSNGIGVIGVTNTGFGVAGFTRLADSTAGYFINESSGLGVRAVSNSGRPFVAANNTVEFMSILANGSVGIGTSTPGERITVISTDARGAGYFLSNTGNGLSGQTQNGFAGILGISNTFGTTSVAVAGYANTGYGGYFQTYFGSETALAGIANAGVGVYAQSTTGRPFVAANATVEFMSIVANGNVGIGGGASGSKLIVYSASSEALRAQSDTSTPFVAGNATVEFMKLVANGNIGMGTGSPSAKLELLTTTNNGLRISNGTVTSIFYTSSVGTGTGSIGTVSNHPFDIYSNNTIRVRVNADGNVSIGNASSTNAGLLVYSAANNQNFNAITGVYSSNQGAGGTGTGGAGVAGYNLNGFGVLGATSNGIAVIGVTNTGIAVAGFSRLAGSTAVYGENQSSGVGVHGKSTSGLPLLCQNNTSNVAYVDNAGNFVAYQNITAYASDERLKTNFVEIPNALEKVNQLSGYTFDWLTEKCDTLGFSPSLKHEHGLKAQEVQRVMEDAVCLAPFDRDLDNNQQSKSGEKYLTIRYERLIPLLIQAIKELKNEIDELKK